MLLTMAPLQWMKTKVVQPLIGFVFTTLVLLQTINSVNCLSNIELLRKSWNPKWGDIPSDLGDFTALLSWKYSGNKQYLTKHDIVPLLESLYNQHHTELNASYTSAYRILTDCSLNPALEDKDMCRVVHECLSVDSLMKIQASISAADSAEVDLQALCPVLLYQAESGLCRGKELALQHTKKRPSAAEVWGYGLLFVTVISVSSMLGVMLMPMMAKEFYQKMLTVLVGLAVGSLSSSAVFHLIPQAFDLIPEGGGDHRYLNISLVVMGGIWFFFMVERFLKIVTDYKKRKDDATMVDTSRCELDDSQSQQSVPTEAYATPMSETTLIKDEQGKNGMAPYPNNLTPSAGVIYSSQELAIKSAFGHEPKPHHHHEHNVNFTLGKDNVIATVAWMIIFGDGFHNFIDGLSLGAAFNESILTGISISVAILCEEIPHELGDFAVLLSSGMTMKQAVLYNFLSACTCYLGLIIGILLGNFTEATTEIFALAAGMFLYISLVDMVPELNEVAEKESSRGVVAGLKVLLMQNLGMFLGVFTLFTLAYYQDHITFE